MRLLINWLDLYLLASDRNMKCRGLIYEISIQLLVLLWEKEGQCLVQRGRMQWWWHRCIPAVFSSS